MSTTIGCPIPGASQPKEPVRLIDIKEILQYDGAHFTWSGGRNCLSEQKAAFARGYDAGMKFIVDKVKKAPTIDPESLRPTAHWIRDSGGSTNVVCSACNAISFAAYNFCPHCGKRMVNADD
jgi:hypothetical protein